MNIQTPDFFVSGDEAFRNDKNGTFTRIENDETLGMISIKKGVQPEFIVWKNIKPISRRQFRMIFLTAISEIAGFKLIGPKEETEEKIWQDQEADVQS